MNKQNVVYPHNGVLFSNKIKAPYLATCADNFGAVQFSQALFNDKDLF
jgi:hypothetical protein